jgi:PAS domain S-box-containing protein
MNNLSPWDKSVSVFALQNRKKTRSKKKASHPRGAPSRENPFLDDFSFRRFFEKSPIPMVIDDIHQTRHLGVCLEVNEAFEKLFGYTLKETRNLNHWFRRAFPEPKYRKKIIQEWLRDIRWARNHGGVMPLAEDRVRTKDGREVVVEVGGVILGNFLLTTFVDRTKRVKAEADLTQSESLFRMIFEKIPTPAAHVDFGRKDYGENPVFFMNQAVHRVFGYTKKELPDVEAWITKAYPDPVYRKKVHDKFFGSIARLKNVGDIVPPLEVQMRCKDGSEKIMLWTGFKMPRGFFAMSTDLTEVRKAQDQLMESEVKFRKFFENLPFPAVHVEFGKKHEMNRFLGMNRAFTETFGYTHRELHTLNDWLVRAYPDPAYRKEANETWFRAVEHSVKTGQFIPAHEYRMRCKDGREIIFATTGVIFEKSMLVVGVDRTELRKAEQQMRQMARQEAEKLQQKLQTSVVASAVAHEVNQPLSEILMKSQLALQRAESLTNFDPQLRLTLQGIVEDSRRVEKTIERMRALLRNVPTQKVSLDLRDVVDSSLLYLKRTMKEEGIRLEFRIPVKPVVVSGDASQLQLAVSNLLRNAVEAIQESSAKVRRIKIQLSLREGQAEIKIADSGPGMDPGLREQIFSPLFSTRPKGAGLGLYLVRTTVLNHGGEVSVKTSALGGAEFCLRIPLHQEKQTQPRRRE